MTRLSANVTGRPASPLEERSKLINGDGRSAPPASEPESSETGRKEPQKARLIALTADLELFTDQRDRPYVRLPQVNTQSCRLCQCVSQNRLPKRI